MKYKWKPTPLKSLRAITLGAYAVFGSLARTTTKAGRMAELRHHAHWEKDNGGPEGPNHYQQSGDSRHHGRSARQPRRAAGSHLPPGTRGTIGPCRIVDWLRNSQYNAPCASPADSCDSGDSSPNKNATARSLNHMHLSRDFCRIADGSSRVLNFGVRVHHICVVLPKWSRDPELLHY